MHRRFSKVSQLVSATATAKITPTVIQTYSNRHGNIFTSPIWLSTFVTRNIITLIKRHWCWNNIFWPVFTDIHMHKIGCWSSQKHKHKLICSLVYSLNELIYLQHYTDTEYFPIQLTDSKSSHQSITNADLVYSVNRWVRSNNINHSALALFRRSLSLSGPLWKCLWKLHLLLISLCQTHDSTELLMQVCNITSNNNVRAHLF